MILSPCARVNCIPRGCALECVLCVVHSPLEIFTMWIYLVVLIVIVYIHCLYSLFIYVMRDVRSSFSVVASYTAVYLFVMRFGAGLELG